MWCFLSKAEGLFTDCRQGLNSGIVLFKTFSQSCCSHRVAGTVLLRNVTSLSNKTNNVANFYWISKLD